MNPNLYWNGTKLLKLVSKPVYVDLWYTKVITFSSLLLIKTSY